MKNVKLWLVTIWMLSNHVMWAQNIKPKDKFLLRVHEKNLQIQSEDTIHVDLSIERSKPYLNKELSFSTSKVPQGVELFFEENPVLTNSVQLKIVATQDIAPGNYTLLLYGSHGHTKKGLTMMLEVIERNKLSSKQL